MGQLVKLRTADNVDPANAKFDYDTPWSADRVQGRQDRRGNRDLRLRQDRAIARRCTMEWQHDLPIPGDQSSVAADGQ